MTQVAIIVGYSVLVAGGLALALAIVTFSALYCCDRLVKMFKITDVLIGTAKYRRDARKAGYIDREATRRTNMRES